MRFDAVFGMAPLLLVALALVSTGASVSVLAHDDDGKRHDHDTPGMRVGDGIAHAAKEIAADPAPTTQTGGDTGRSTQPGTLLSRDYQATPHFRTGGTDAASCRLGRALVDTTLEVRSDGPSCAH